MEVLQHHIKQEVCLTRPKYREGRIPKVVKVYTCSQESTYLLCTNIPSIGAHEDLVKLFSIYGDIQEHKTLHEYPSEPYTDTILIKFLKIQNARTAKIKMDNYNYCGGSLHVCYAPEHETIDDLRDKLKERRLIVSLKCKKYDDMKFGTIEYDCKMKRNRFQNDRSTKKRQFISKKKVTNTNCAETKSHQDQKSDSDLVCFPKLPDDWVKESVTGNVSLDETVKEISNQMSKTLPQPSVETSSKKRKRTLRI